MYQRLKLTNCLEVLCTVDTLTSLQKRLDGWKRPRKSFIYLTFTYIAYRNLYRSLYTNIQPGRLLLNFGL